MDRNAFQTRKYFDLDESYTNLNFGSFGSACKPASVAKSKYVAESEANPDLFLRVNYRTYVNRTRLAVSELVDCDVEDLVLTANSTDSTNAVLRSLKWTEGDTVLFFNTVYGACEKSLIFLANQFKIKPVAITLNYPMTDDEICARFSDACKAIGPVKLALFDAISSAPSVVFPWERIVALCRQFGVLSLVDGAHAIGQIPISIRSAQPDYMCSNLHKWLYCPRSAAFLYVRKELQPSVHATLISHGYPGEHDIDAYPEDVMTPFVTEFDFTGTIDYSSRCAGYDAIEFRKTVCGGESRIISYNRLLAERGGQIVAKKLGTAIMQNPDDLIASMVNVRLPIDQLATDTGIDLTNPTTAIRMRQVFEHVCIKHNTYIMTFCHNGAWWARFSAQIFLTEKDFEFASDVILDAIEAIKAEL
ncbi:hypothetical protein CANCADRAFT_25129 [Tortispora caseinolytica NRRL Y-17796]|uniref:Aminotransferase class V domain-containing protein n=1 Tax=Tortispora caseinolytica NRRL Y-17796 TaxID=767744 RepID=A0A1E4TFB3_9ASCO|nr:hypothetical protein CANCADRAFT_25129 [Tortispora caseinolytica NRRL Y-17796]